jgi:hypothetical protein
MVAVPEVYTSAPMTEADAGQLTVSVHCHRVVAIVGTTMELLRPESDLLRIISGSPHVDLLVAAVDEAVDAPGALGVLAGSMVDPCRIGLSDDGSESDDDTADELDNVDDAEEGHRAEIRAEIAALGLPGLHVHRLDLTTPLNPNVEPDLIAALSELVGFDPEPGVYCLAPEATPGDVGRSAMSAAAQRIAQIYGLPLLRYRCLELAVVPEQRGSTSI